MKITVTQKDIDNGRPGLGDMCPIALAVKRLTRKSIHVGAGLMTVGVRRNSKSLYELPWIARNFIHSFDNGAGVSGFSFEAEEIQPDESGYFQ